MAFRALRLRGGRGPVSLLLLCGIATAAPAQNPPASMVGVQDVAWSASGRSLFFSAMRVKPDYSDYTPEKWGVYRYDLGTKRVTLVAAKAFSVVASPSKAEIIVGRLVAGNRDLYVLDEEGREVSRLTADPAEDFGAAWSPDGKRIAFTTKRGGRSEVHVAEHDGSNPRRLVDAGTDRTLNPSWSPDGRTIAYYREKGDGRDQVHVVAADGARDMNVTRDTFNNVYPGWTPDGRIVYGQTSKGMLALAFTVNVDGTNKRPFLGLKSFFIRYSPDGRLVAYLEDLGNAVGVSIADRMGRRQATVLLDAVGSGADESSAGARKPPPQ